jgi:hypothetical protein
MWLLLPSKKSAANEQPTASEPAPEPQPDYHQPQHQPQPQTGRLYREHERQRIIAALLASSSILVAGEEGSGKTVLGESVADELRSQGFEVAFIEPATPKQILLELAAQLGIETTTIEGKPLTIDGLKKAIANYLKANTVFLIFDDAHVLNSQFRTWLKLLKRQGQPLLLIATDPPRTDVFLNMSALILKPLSEYMIRDLMEKAALEKGIPFKPSDFARLQQRAGGNPMLAQRIIEEEYLGLDPETGDHSRYFDITPLILLLGAVFIVIRFIALGTSNPTLYILAGSIGALTLTFGRVLSAMPKDSRRIKA